jgi:hypothetical protein
MDSGQTISLFGWLLADGWCWFVLREEYCWLIAGGWFVLREKYCWLVADKPIEQVQYGGSGFLNTPSVSKYLSLLSCNLIIRFIQEIIANT